MSKYTKKQRHEIYKKALKLLGKKRFICICLYVASDLFLTEEINKENFPEFFLFQPQTVSHFGAWDFFDDDEISCYSPEYIFPRQIVLDFCIEMTK